MQKVNPFFESALRELPRLLGQIDRNVVSRTYGSCDRAFWLYRTNDISSMRYQEAALTLSLLYKTPFNGNHYYGDKNILALANGIIKFACDNVHEDGSFDEWYINEGSFVCTAFVSVALSRAAILLGNELEHRDLLLRILRNNGEWLSNRTETLVMNQLSGAILSLHNIYILTGDEKFKKACEIKLDILLSSQNKEGWWNEYGGPDIGYLSLTVDYLSEYYNLTKDQRVGDAIEKAVGFISYFVHPDGTAGGEYMSRNTEYLIPSGFVRFASKNSLDVARYIAGFLNEDKGITPRSLDDRYICYILNNWIEAGRLWEIVNVSVFPSILLWDRNGKEFFPDAGIIVEYLPERQIFLNLKKGGGIRIYTKGGLIIDTGVVVRSDGKVYSANNFNAVVTFSKEGNSFASECRLLEINAPLLTTLRAVAFKFFQFTFGRVTAAQKIVKKMLRTISIVHPGRNGGIKYRRLIKISDDNIVITDILSGEIPRGNMIIGENNTYALVPSSRYVSAGIRQSVLCPTSESYDVSHGESKIVRIYNISGI
jgi:hypothetical protein